MYFMHQKMQIILLIFTLYDTSGDNWNYEDNFSFTVYLECDNKVTIRCDSDEYFESWRSMRILMETV